MKHLVDLKWEKKLQNAADRSNQTRDIGGRKRFETGIPFNNSEAWEKPMLLILKKWDKSGNGERFFRLQHPEWQQSHPSERWSAFCWPSWSDAWADCETPWSPEDTASSQCTSDFISNAWETAGNATETNRHSTIIIFTRWKNIHNMHTELSPIKQFSRKKVTKLILKEWCARRERRNRTLTNWFITDNFYQFWPCVTVLCNTFWGQKK